MRKEEKKRILLADISGRISYGVKCKVETCAPPATIASIDDEGGVSVRLVDENGMTRGVGWDYLVDIKPYLRPMESMNSDEYEEWQVMMRKSIETRTPDAVGGIGADQLFIGTCKSCADCIEWLNKYHFDFRGLIGMKLALPAPEGMYAIKRKRKNGKTGKL